MCRTMFSQLYRPLFWIQMGELDAQIKCISARNHFQIVIE